MKKTVDVVIPSYKPDHKFDRLMHMLQKQTYPIGTILIVNTEEKFFPEKGYETWQNVQIRHIETEDFDHGGTRVRPSGDQNVFLFECLCDVPQKHLRKAGRFRKAHHFQ